MGFTGVLSKSFLSHNETIADAMMDRLIHTAHKIELNKTDENSQTLTFW